jgi:hypothetical protein
MREILPSRRTVAQRTKGTTHLQGRGLRPAGFGLVRFFPLGLLAFISSRGFGGVASSRFTVRSNCSETSGLLIMDDDILERGAFRAMAAGQSREVLLSTIGEAAEAFTTVEAAQSNLLAIILRITDDAASVIYFTIQNVRARHEMFEALLNERFGSIHKKYWDSYGKYMITLSVFRNAIIHWHPVTILSLSGPSEAGIRRATPSGRGKYLTTPQIKPFIQDCIRLRLETDQFAVFLRDGGEPTLHDRFLRPLTYRNQAVLGQPPKEPPPPPRSSRRKQKPQ